MTENLCNYITLYYTKPSFSKWKQKIYVSNVREASVNTHESEENFTRT